jgi:hypothetical protein
MATEQSVGIFEIIKALASCLIAGIGDKPISLQETSWANKLVWIPPERRA